MSASSEIRDPEKVMTTQEQVASTQPDVVPAHEDAGHVKGPIESPGGGRTVGILFASVLLVAIVYGLHVRSSHEKQLVRATADAAILPVNVVHPTLGSTSQDLV